jgi:hypothetical protein
MVNPAAHEIEAWLAEGLAAWRGGEPSRALELWYLVLDKDPQNPHALELVQYVRDNLHIDVLEPAFALPDPALPLAPAGEGEIFRWRAPRSPTPGSGAAPSSSRSPTSNKWRTQ